MQRLSGTYFGKLGGNGSFLHGGKAPLRTALTYVITSVRGKLAESFAQQMKVKEPGAHPDDIDPFMTHSDVVAVLGLSPSASQTEVEEALKAGGVSYSVLPNKR